MVVLITIIINSEGKCYIYFTILLFCIIQINHLFPGILSPRIQWLYVKVKHCFKQYTKTFSRSTVLVYISLSIARLQCVCNTNFKPLISNRPSLHFVFPATTKVNSRHPPGGRGIQSQNAQALVLAVAAVVSMNVSMLDNTCWTHAWCSFTGR